MAIIARGLTRRFGKLRVLRGLDLEVERGRSLAILGSNGAGKTTLLRILAGLLRKDGGSYEVLGDKVPASPAHRRRVGMMGHETWLYGDLTAIENLEYYRRLYRVPDLGRPAELLERVGLRSAAGRSVRGFSRGMSQRLALARALLHEPELLYLDEPFTGLDRQGARILSAVLEEQRAAGTTVVLVTHDFERAAAVADEAVILGGGKVAWHSDDAGLNLDGLESAYAALGGGKP
ncbi:MAG: heme ABC exporter ATP-binding protein CcmA [Candidatus Binatia bacterium]